MRRFFTHILLLFTVSCSQPAQKETVKNKPEFGKEITDPDIKAIVKEYFNISAGYNIRFTKNVTIGFAKIGRGNVIGTCTFASDFREITLDTEYWSSASWTTKVALLSHELTHCYCYRNHDFDDGTLYPDSSIGSMIDSFMVRQPFTPLRPPGYLDDNCPKSLMHPVIMGDRCFESHYSYYMDELFHRCKPY